MTCTVPGTPSSSERLAGVLAGSEEKVGEPVGLDPVGLLGHVVAVAAQPRLDVEERHPGGNRGAGAGDRRVGVAADQDRVGLLALDHPGDPLLGDGDALRRWAASRPRGCTRAAAAAGRRSAGPTSPGRSAGPVWTRISSTQLAKASESGAACTISGREPMMETIRGATARSTQRRRPVFSRRRQNSSPASKTDPFSAFARRRRRKCSRRRSAVCRVQMEAHGLTHEQPLDRSRAASRAGRRSRGARFDLVVASLADRPALSPLLIAVALAIRLDSRGPALFRQRRVGYGEREFTLFKFRSMRLDADPRGHREYVTALIKRRSSARRRPQRPLQARRRRPHHPGRPLDPELEPRRAAAALQRRRSAT